MDAEDKLETEPDPCRSKCCPETFVEKETENTNEKSKEDFIVEEKEKDTTEEEHASSSRETASFRVVWNKKNYEVTFPVDETVDSLKQHIEKLTGLERKRLISFALKSCESAHDNKCKYRIRQLSVLAMHFTVWLVMSSHPGQD